MEHNLIPAGKRHGPHQWEVADQAARLALSVSSGGVGQTCWQKSDNTIWIWTAANAWAQIGGSGLPQQVSFSTTIPLDGLKIMPRTQISSAVSLTVGAKVVGGQCRTPFLGDGVNVPTISGSEEWEYSRGFNNSAGALSVLDMWSDDGVYAYHSWSRPVGSGAGDTVAPNVVSASINGATVTVVWSESLSNTPSASAFSFVGAGGVTQTASVSSQSGGTTTLTLATPAANGNTVTMNISAGAASDAAGNSSAAVTARAVVNNTPAADTDPPVLTAASVNGGTLTLTYNEALNTALPGTSAFSVLGAGGVTQTPSAVEIAGAVVTLTLATPAVVGNSVTVNYTVPGVNPIRDINGNVAVALSGQAVTNSTGANDYQNWLDALVAAGGDASSTEKSAVQTFINTAINGPTPFWTNILRANVFVNDTNGSLVPFKKQNSSSNDTSPAATTANAGGRSNVSGTGYVNTQTACPAIGGLSVYLRDAQTSSPIVAKILMGARNTDNSQVFRLLCNADNTAGRFAGSIGGINSNQPSAATPDGQARTLPGHYHAHRNTQTSLTTYRNGSVYVPEFTTDLGAAAISEPIYVHAQNSAGTATGFTQANTSIGFYAILTGAMTSQQIAAYHAAVLAMMTTMGRNL